ncbi:uncharacterized protein LOC126322605 [Schistocerca gregaria]|uniref:uncharacterized protein LOC126322605 n=1 Tax=Schistocerca gregaria TaxID=7010 RepID=UPI00211EB092|nr:uncharacterized protein LOC126322605 [Schistocerca gregaria]XP_049850437.1 uncharacterized protein LOC126322605 [Schistocerca gregaria]
MSSHSCHEVDKAHRKSKKNVGSLESLPLQLQNAYDEQSGAFKNINEIRQTFASKGPKDFQKIRILGRGGVGKVYLVRLKNTDKLFAMKVLKQDEMIQKNKVKRVLTEREILATANHPFIVNLYYSFQTRSRLYFVMDYCAGGEFYRTIQTQPNKCLTEDQIRFYAAEVLLALEYLHMMGFIYRDLKPENILLHASGHIRLTDFDLCKASVTPVNVRVIQSMMGNSVALVAEPSLVTNSFVGTEEYLAPEVIKGRGYRASVDWWTFGILLYEMLYGITPFRGVNRYDTFSKIEKSQLKFPDRQHSSVSKECKNLIRKLLLHDPKKRLGSEHGATEIRAHPFFGKITWPLLLNMTPPLVPTLSGPQDTRYFSNRIVDDEKDAEDLEAIDASSLEANHPFKSFTSLNREREAPVKAASKETEMEKKIYKKKSSKQLSSREAESNSKGAAEEPYKRDSKSHKSLSRSHRSKIKSKLEFSNSEEANVGSKCTKDSVIASSGSQDSDCLIDQKSVVLQKPPHKR